MTLPGRHSLFWKLCALLVLLCLLVLWLSRSGGAHLERKSYHLSPAAQATLAAYSAEAHAAWRSAGAAGVDRWLAQLPGREPGWAMVIGSNLESLASQPLDETQRGYVTFMRKADWPMSKRAEELPAISLPFPGAEQDGQLVMQLPQRFMPSGLPLLVRGLVNGLFPAALALLAGGLLYRVLIGPLAHLRAQANALRADRLDTRVAAAVSQRSDELGELGRAFDHMAERLQHTVLLQRRLLADLSHELRTPLSRLQVAAENDDASQALRERVNRELQCMRQLVDDTLELVWLDTERPRQITETVDVDTLWELLRENACFESGWPAERLPNLLQDACRVRGHLNGLAQAMENILRNAIRHSPVQGQVSLGGKRDAEHWHLWIDDQGPGVAEAALESIFLPFTRLDAARPGGEGFGLGLAIARYRVQLQGGQLWAENLNPGLRLNLRLPA